MSRVRDKADFQFAGEDYTHGGGVKYVANMIQTTDLTANGTITDIHLQDIQDVAAVSASNDGYYLKYDHATTSFAWSQVSGGGGGTMNDLIDDTTPQLGGALSANGFNIEFGESANAGADDTLIFGTDFRIYKATGGNGIIQWTNNSSGMMQIISSRDIDIRAGNSDRITGRTTGAVDIYYAGVKKFETTNTGANIIGTLTTDGLTVDGDLTVNGTTTTINTQNLLVSDNIITLNSDVTGTPSQNAGVAVERGTSNNVDIRWNESTDKWEFTNDGAIYSDIGSGGDVVDDLTPQLGGDLDVNGNAIEYTFSLSGSSSPNYIFAGGNHFFSGATNNPTLYLTRGVKYKFTNISSSHPFRIQSQNSAGGSLYSTGVSNNNGTGTVTFIPPMDAPDELYYYCNAHSSMNGTINIVGAGGASTGDITFSGSTISSSGTTVTVNDNLTVAGTLTSSQAGAPILTSASSITLEADSSSRVHVSQSPLRLYNVSTTNRNLITLADGDLVYDSTLNKTYVAQDGSWNQMLTTSSANGYVGAVIEQSATTNTNAGTIVFYANDYQILRLNVNQNNNRTLFISGDSGTTFNNSLATNEVRTIAVSFQNGTTPYYINLIQIDGTTVTPKWSGGTAPSGGSASSDDWYTFSIVKTGSAQFEVYGTFTKFA
tara:strand:- start:94 stop:2067 length:1974 start_codon:yes stop_codon:yes gene_type:complete